MELDVKEQMEIDFWLNSKRESPTADSLENILDKISDAPILLDCLHRHNNVFLNSTVILELGAGQGWGSCIVKRLYPQSHVITTDISGYALASMQKWERIFQVKVDRISPCRSYKIPVDDASLNLIFCFAAAHHFVAHRKTLSEIQRTLVPGGHCFYFYEPSCPRFIHKFAKWRVNRKRPDVPEDVLIFPAIRNLAESTGLTCSLDFYPSIIKRDPLETIYYSVLRQFPALRFLIPSTINYHFVKF